MSLDIDFVAWISNQISTLIGSTEDQFRELLSIDPQATTRLAGFYSNANPSRLFFSIKQGAQQQDLRESTIPPSRESTTLSGVEKKPPQMDTLCMNCDDGLVHSKGKLVCIYRSREEPVGHKFQDYVHVAEINKNMIQSSQIALQEVFLPMMVPSDCSIWGDCNEDDRQYLLKSMKSIVGSLSEASRSIKGGLELHRMDYKPEDAAKNKSDENAVKEQYVGRWVDGRVDLIGDSDDED